MLKRYFENLSWVDIFLRLFQLAAIAVIVVGIYNTVVAAKYTSAQWATLVFAGLVFEFLDPETPLRL